MQKIDKLLQTKRTLIMGIINTTPDSFSGDGIYQNTDKTIHLAKQMISDGADMLDIGGESSRPGAEQISLDEELQRIIPTISSLRQEVDKDFILSVDTYKAAVAREAIKAGANCINSLGGFLLDNELASVIAESHVAFIPYHMAGTFETRHEKHIQIDIMKEMRSFFAEQIKIGEKYGVQPTQYILDPGIGFSKTLKQTIDILQRLKELQTLHLPILIGVSRKSHVGIVLQDELKLSDMPSPNERIEGALAETAIAVDNGAKIIRTHDVKETKRFLALYERVKK